MLLDSRRKMRLRRLRGGIRQPASVTRLPPLPHNSVHWYLLRLPLYRLLDEVNQVWWTKFSKGLEGLCSGIDDRMQIFLEDSAMD